MEGLSEGCQESSAVYSLGPQLTTGPRLGKLEGLQEKAWICLLPHFHLMTTIPPTLDSVTSSVLPR